MQTHLVKIKLNLPKSNYYRLLDLLLRSQNLSFFLKKHLDWWIMFFFQMNVFFLKKVHLSIWKAISDTSEYWYLIFLAF
jgi:hypothetical protein